MFRNRINNQIPYTSSISQSRPAYSQLACPSSLQRQPISYSVFLQQKETNADRLSFWEGEPKRESQLANFGKLHKEGKGHNGDRFQQGKVKEKARQETLCRLVKNQHYIPINNANNNNSNSNTKNNNNNIFFNNSIATMDYRNRRQHGIQDGYQQQHQYDIEHEQQNEHGYEHEHLTLPLDFQLEMLEELEITKIKDMKSQELGSKVLEFGKRQGKLRKRHKQYISHLKIINYEKNNKPLFQNREVKQKQTKDGLLVQFAVQSPQQIVLQKTKIKQKKRYEFQKENENENENSNNNKKTQYLDMDKLKQRYQFLERGINQNENQNQKGQANFKTKIKGKNTQNCLDQRDLNTIHEVRPSDIIIHNQNRKRYQDQNKENMEKTKQHIKKITKFIRDKDKFKDLTFKLLNKNSKPNKNLTQKVQTHKKIFPQQAPSQIQSPMSQFSHRSPSQQKSPTPAQISNPSQTETSNQQSLQARIGLIRPSLCHLHKISSALISPFLSPLPSPTATPLHSRSSSFALTQIDHINSINQELGLGLKIIDDSFQIQFQIQMQDQYQGKGKGKAKEIFDQILVNKGINSNNKIKQNNGQYILHVGKGQIDDFVLEESVISPDCQELRGKLDQMLEGRD